LHLPSQHDQHVDVGLGVGARLRAVQHDALETLTVERFETLPQFGDDPEHARFHARLAVAEGGEENVAMRAR
jgi:hypothetical protein